MLLDVPNSISSHLMKKILHMFGTVANLDQASFLLLSTYYVWRHAWVSFTYNFSKKLYLNSETLSPLHPIFCLHLPLLLKMPVSLLIINLACDFWVYIHTYSNSLGCPFKISAVQKMLPVALLGFIKELTQMQ